jgi:hypothetical protein
MEHYSGWDGHMVRKLDTDLDGRLDLLLIYTKDLTLIEAATFLPTGGFERIEGKRFAKLPEELRTGEQSEEREQDKAQNPDNS